MNVLLSIKPKFAEKILDGTKRFEFRKRLFKDPRVKKVIIYATKPIGRVVGEFSIEGYTTGTPEWVWTQTGNYAGISKDYFFEYFLEKEWAVAIHIGKVSRYPDPMQLNQLRENLSPPQSFVYLCDVDDVLI